MPDILTPIRVSELPEASSVSNTDLLIIDNGEQTQKIPIGTFNEEATGSAKRYADEALLSAQNAETQAQAASGSATIAGNHAQDANKSAQDAEAWAVGKRNGADVHSTDEAYHNNAKYFSEQAHASATEAAGSADDAAQSAASISGLEDQIEQNTEDVTALKSAFNANIAGTDEAISLEKITPFEIVNGYITSEGNWNNSDVYKVIKYQTTPGTIIFIRALKVVGGMATYQFQDSDSIPHSGNTHIIGNTHTDSAEGYITVPAGATYLLITDIANGLNGLYTNGLEEVEDNLEKISGSITMTDNVPCSFITPISKIDLALANYSGKKAFISNKNLLPQFPAITDHEVTCTQNADGSITLSGTANGPAAFQLSVNVMPNLGPGKYTLSCGNSATMGDSNTYINIAVDGSWGAIKAPLNSVNGKTTFEIPVGSKVTAARIRISSGVVVPSNFKIYPQIEEGETVTEFVKHDGFVLNITSANTETECFIGYNYVCVQSGVTGTVSYIAANIAGDIKSLDARVTVLEEKPDNAKFYGKKIVCFGDSITGNFPAPTDYPSMIASMTGATVYNAGFGGCCMSDNNQKRKLFTMCRLVDSIVAGSGNYGDFTAQSNSGVSITYAGTSTNYVPDRITMLSGIDWTTIDYITIAYGTNDWNSNYALDNENDPDDTTTYLGAFRYSVEKLLTKFPNIKILVITPLWRWWDTNTGMPSEIHSDYIDSNDYAKGTGYKLWQYGDALAEAAKLYHIPVLNLYWNCMMTKQNRYQYFETTDGTHPKEAGRYLMAQMISAWLSAKY